MNLTIPLDARFTIGVANIDFRNNRFRLSGAVDFYLPGTETLISSQMVDFESHTLLNIPELTELISKEITWQKLATHLDNDDEIPF